MNASEPILRRDTDGSYDPEPCKTAANHRVSKRAVRLATRLGIPLDEAALLLRAGERRSRRADQAARLTRHVPPGQYLAEQEHAASVLAARQRFFGLRISVG